jgi:hypothetical protein
VAAGRLSLLLYPALVEFLLSGSTPVMQRSKVLALAAVLEAVTGLALMIHPSLVSQLLFGGGVSGTGRAVGRFAGFGLLSLGLACWPGREAVGTEAPGLRGMLAYGVLATLYLVYLGISRRPTGSLLWPAAAIHLVLTILLARDWLASRTQTGTARPR